MGKLKDDLRRYRRRAFEAIGSHRYSRVALNDLDLKLKPYLDFDHGFFVEAGANDGISQSNTYHLEKFQKWKGLLIEAVPEKANACRQNRPGSIVVQTALVSDDLVTQVEMQAAGLMAYVSESFDDPQAEAAHATSAKKVQSLKDIPRITVRARTLSSVLDEVRAPKVNFFSLDVEGYELEVLKGMELARHRPDWILVETKHLDAVLLHLAGTYELHATLTFHDYLLKLVR